MEDSNADPVRRYSMRATVWRRLSHREGRSRSASSRRSRRRSTPVRERYGSPVLAHSRKTAGRSGSACMAASSCARSSPTMIAVITGTGDLAPALLAYGFRIDQRLDFGEEAGNRFRPLVGVFAVADGDQAIFLLAIAHYQHVRDLLHLGFADLEVHLLIAIIHGGADSGIVELLPDVAGVLGLAIGDGQHDGLNGREPHRERAGVVLDQDAEEALDGAVQSAMHHQRLVGLTIFGDVLEAEAAGQGEIEMHGGKLPLAADGVHQLDIDLGPVESGFVGNRLGGDLQLIARPLQGALGHRPLFGRAIVFAARAAIPGGNLGVVLIEAVGAQGVDGELEAVHHFVFNLVGGAEDVGVILREAADAEEAVEHAGALVAVERAEPHGEVAVAALAVGIDQDVERAVHRLELVIGVVQLNGREHVLRVEIGVAGSLPQVEARDVGGVDQGVAALQVLIAHPVFELFADDAALGMEEDESGTGEFLDAEEVELLAELAVVALLGLFHLFEVGVEFLGGEEGGAVNALELLVVLVALPVGAGDTEQLEGLDLRGVGDVGAAAEIDEAGSEGVLGEDLAGLLFDELALHPGFGVLLEALFFGGKDAFVGEGAGLDLPHLLLDLLEVVGGEGGGAVEIVVEAVVDGRADAELGFGIEFEHGGGEEVGGGVAVDLERFGVPGGEDLNRGVLLDGAGEVEHLAVDLGRQAGVRQAGADASGDIDGTCPGRDGLFTPVGQSNFDVTHKEFSA